MATPWFRLWTDMVNDPKWRTISRASGERIGDVIAVYLHMLTCAANATERGRTQGWSDEDVATALDLEIAQVTKIREAMQGRVLDGDYLRGWEKRQPKREDEGSSHRAKAWREAQKAKQEEEAERDRTRPNASERKTTLDTDTDKKESSRATRLPADWEPSAEEVEYCRANRPDLDPYITATKFRNHWVAKSGKDATKRDWSLTWQNWVLGERAGTVRSQKPRGVVV